MLKISIMILLIIAGTTIFKIAEIKIKDKEKLLWIGYAVGIIVSMIIVSMYEIPARKELEQQINELKFEQSYIEYVKEDGERQ